jgi:MYXO-CTERM domain-containing protein
MAAVAGVGLASTPASADTAANPPGPASTSTGTAVLKYECTDGLATSIDTGFVGIDAAKVRAVIKIDPVRDGGPLYTVDMPSGAVVQASWAGDKKIVLKAANGAQTDGSVKVRHTLTPSVEMKLAAFGLTAEFGFDTTELLNKIPGTKFNYDSRGTQAFAPWGFTPVETTLAAPDIDNSVLFSLPFSTFPKILDPAKWAGKFGLRATTKPTFKYKTTKVMILGTETPFTAEGGEAVMDVMDGDFMEVMAQVDGEMEVAGAITLQPFLTMTKAFGKPFSTSLGVDVYAFNYTVPTSKVAFQSTLVHIPLPNVHAPNKGIDLGDVKVGGSATRTVTVENTGEMAATMTFASSDPRFQVPAGSITVAPKGTFDLEVSFSSNDSGPALSDITVLSNDPDAPVQTFQIGANGADVRDADPAANAGDAAADSGCGCKTAGTTTSTGGWAGLGLLALGITVAARRRRTAA